MAEDATPRPGFEIGKDGVGTIVVGVDGTPPSLNAAAWAAGLARRERANLVLVFVEPVTGPAYWSGLGIATVTEAAQEYVAELREQAGQYLDRYGIPWELVHHRGEPAGGIEAVAKEHLADCIVVGRSRHGKGLLGSVPKSLVTNAARPVIVVP